MNKLIYIPKDLEKHLPEMIAEAKKDNDKDGLGKYLVGLHIEKKRGEKS